MMGNISNNPESQHFSVSKEQMSSNYGFNTLMIPNNMLNSITGHETSSLVKRKTEMGQHEHPAKKQTTQIISAAKSSEAVRSKMRESLAAALALVSRKPNNVSSIEKDGSGSEEVFPSKESDVVGGTTVESRMLSAELPPNESSFNGGSPFQEFQYSSILPEEDVQFSDSFFVKDDLLQGNGLSWAFDLDVEVQNADKAQAEREEVKEVAIPTPEILAFEIEAELFKLYSGVNKKYKEKGRSLLFNLKDRNNPELRERVVSGEISPERLCSMSAEELASKELSQWRMAKAEEFAQMVVLPDTEVDIRRLVKKTHKGEYQVEFEHDEGIVEEVSGGTNMLTQLHPKKVIATTLSENRDFSDSLIIPSDGTDLMQGLMVDDLKDEAYLPPIVSLDEFMESLNSEPPFENLTADAAEKIPVSHANSPKDTTSKKADFVKKDRVDTTLKKTSGSLRQKVLPNTTAALEIEYIWEGILHLNTSSSVVVRGVFQSGEKTSTKEWSTSLEIKGRVRVDAFEKFLQELPQSRTRAVMVLNFALKDKSSKDQLSYISEAVDSYAADERLGFVEAGPGVEIYLCPPNSKMAERLNKHIMPKENLQNNNSAENGLIGIVIWRRRGSHVSKNTISPKHKKQPFADDPNRSNDSSNFNNNNINNVLCSKPQSKEGGDDDDDGDVPPGFGPAAAARAAAKDDDDLPEFNFAGELNLSVPRFPSQSSHRSVKVMTQNPVDKMRELIKKYGQSTEPCNEEDDDMPEWRPEVQVQPPPQIYHQPFPVARGHRLPPVHLLPVANQRIAPMVSNMRSPRGLASPPPPGGRRAVQPPLPLHGARWRPY